MILIWKIVLLPFFLRRNYLPGYTGRGPQGSRETNPRPKDIFGLTSYRVCGKKIERIVTLGKTLQD